MPRIHARGAAINSRPEDDDGDSAAFTGLAGQLTDLYRHIAPPWSVLLFFLAYASAYYGRALRLTTPWGEIWPNLYCAQCSASDFTPLQSILRRFLLACDQFQPHQIHISIGLGSGQSLVFAVRDPVRRPEKGYSAGLPLYVMETLVDAGAAEKRVLITQPLLGNPRTRSFSLYEQLHNAFVGAELRQSIPYRDGGSLASLEPHVSVAMTCRPTDFQRTSPDLAGLFLIDNAPLAPAALISASPKVGEEVELEWLQFQFLTTLEWVRGRPEVTLSEGARRIFEAAVDDLCAYSPVAPQLLLKLGLNFTALDCSKVLSAAHAQASVSVLRHSLAVAQELHGGPSDSFVKQHLMAGIQRRGELTATEIHDVLGRNIDCDTIHRVLASLVHEGRLHMVRGPSTGGARPTLWREGPRPFPHRQSD